jgi:hypothetical protein
MNRSAATLGRGTGGYYNGRRDPGSLWRLPAAAGGRPLRRMNLR